MPPVWFEQTTYRLQGDCSTKWAKRAFYFMCVGWILTNGTPLYPCIIGPLPWGRVALTLSYYTRNFMLGTQSRIRTDTLLSGRFWVSCVYHFTTWALKFLLLNYYAAIIPYFYSNVQLFFTSSTTNFYYFLLTSLNYCESIILHNYFSFKHNLLLFSFFLKLKISNIYFSNQYLHPNLTPASGNLFRLLIRQRFFGSC